MAPDPWDVNYALNGWDPAYATLMNPATPEEPSLVRRTDTGIGFGDKSADAANSLAMSSYEAKARDLRGQQARASSHAMQLLQDSMNKSAEVTPTQGFAAALLAAIPTLGGYMIGKSVGSPELPPGYFEAGGTRKDIGLDKMEFGGANGALFGLAAGNKAAGGYLAGLDADQAQANSVRTKMAALEEQQSNKLESQANAYELAGLNQEQLNARQQAYLNSRDTGGREREPTDFNRFNPAQKANYLASKAGVNADGTPIEKSARNSDLPVAAQNELAERRALIDAAHVAATNISTFKSWAELQAARTASGLDPKADVLAIQDLADRALRSRSGAAAPPAERDQISKFVQGDLTASPALVANFLNRYAERERQFGESQLNTYQALANPETRKDVFAPPVVRKNGETKQEMIDRRTKEIMAAGG